MRNFFENLIVKFDFGSNTLIAMGVGIGVLLIIFGISSAVAGRNPVLVRMGQQARTRRGSSAAHGGILHHAAMDPTGLMKAFIPKDQKERTDIQRQLAMAGIAGPHAVRNFYLLRLSLGFGLPCLLLAIVWASGTGLIALPHKLDAFISGWTKLRELQILTVVVALGFFGPLYWLRAKVEERKRSIEEHFPNALDLIQISVEAGLGFDAAMIRVGNELEQQSPAISHELLTAQREIQAGRTRERALNDMAARAGVEEVASFANVVLQSIQFGTSVSETLTTYAKEMRLHRELRAQEKANKLPVQMSAVLAGLMLPALLLLTLGPIIIRYTHFF